MNIIEIKDVTKKFSNQLALDGLTLDIPEGRIFGLLGPNGAGKTTLIRILTHITMPDSGRVLFHGHPLEAADVENIGYLPEERGLYKKMKVSEQVVYLARLRGLSKQEATRRLKEWFQKFDIDSWWNRRVEELSKGMQQKIQFIATVVHQPDFLIFDEPFSGFDPVNAETLKQEILNLKAQGATVILSTHNMASVEEICDEIALVNHGRLVLNGEINEVRRRFKQSLFHISVANNIDTSNFPTDFQIVKKTSVGNETSLNIQILNNTPSNQLLQYLIEQQYTVTAFNEILPSMNEVFIKAVQS
ncbi:MAG: ATP-binding cassette domain-containing protein [Bacteroidales bacterium]|nr:ATP-binding cassette domain-containing protein [Bacteroidales bacterium]